MRDHYRQQALVACFVLAGILGSIAGNAVAQETRGRVTRDLGDSVADSARIPVVWAVILPPCRTEDSDDCYWDAPRRGNRRGDSFATIRGVTYVWGS